MNFKFLILPVVSVSKTLTLKSAPSPFSHDTSDKAKTT